MALVSVLFKEVSTQVSCILFSLVGIESAKTCSDWVFHSAWSLNYKFTGLNNQSKKTQANTFCLIPDTYL